MARGDLRSAMKGLLEILRDYAKAEKKKIRVVFDGKKESGNDLHQEMVMGIEVFYSIDYSADFLIMNFIKHDPKPNMITVVTSDKEIVSFVNRFRAHVITSENFSDLIKEKLEPVIEKEIPEKSENVNLSDDEISFWEKLFSKKKDT